MCAKRSCEEPAGTQIMKNDRSSPVNVTRSGRCTRPDMGEGDNFHEAQARKSAGRNATSVKGLSPVNCVEWKGRGVIDSRRLQAISSFKRYPLSRGPRPWHAHKALLGTWEISIDRQFLWKHNHFQPTAQVPQRQGLGYVPREVRWIRSSVISPSQPEMQKGYG